MTYQRNIQLEECLDKGFPDCVHEAEEAAGDHDESEDDGSALADVATIGPLHAAQLVDHMAQEREDATPLTAARPLVGALLADRRIELVGRGLDGLVELHRLVGLHRLDVAPLREDGAGVGVSLQLTRRWGARRAGRGTAGTRLATPALLRALSIAGHGESLPSGSRGAPCAAGTTCSTCAA